MACPIRVIRQHRQSLAECFKDFDINGTIALGVTYGNFDIVLDRFPRIFSFLPTRG